VDQFRAEGFKDAAGAKESRQDTYRRLAQAKMNDFKLSRPLFRLARE
jgi:hypothetical protein